MKSKELLDKARHSAAEQARNTSVILRRFWMLVRAFYSSEGKRRARTLFAVLISLALSAAGVQVLMSYAGRDFFTAISNKDESGYWHHLWRYLGTMALAVPIGVFYRYAEERLAILWRQWMTHALVKRYFFNRAYYNLRGSEEIDNPDQRIAEDVKNFTQMTLSFVLITLNSTVTLFAFIGVLWGISLKLVLVLVAYAVGGTIISILIGKKLVGLHFHQYQAEADFRYGVIRVRDNAESIAFYRGEKREHRDIVHRFAEVIANSMRIIGWNRNLSFFTTSYNYLSLVIPTMLVAPMFMRGEVEFGVVTQAGGVFGQVLAALSLIITQFERLSAYTAGVSRIGALWDRLDEFDAEEQHEAADEQVLVEEARRGLVLDHLEVKTPGGKKTLVRDLDLKLKFGQSLLLMGESGTGKSSLLRTVAGLWQTGSGMIQRPALRDMMFLPQRPYMVPGSLRDNLQYPSNDALLDDESLRQSLKTVNLEQVLERVDGNFDAIVDWTNVLSLGEQQRLSFARLVLKKPLIAFLDEATSALDEPNEEHLYQWLKGSGIAYVSVGHRSTLKPFHQRLLLLLKGGDCELSPLGA